MARARTTVPFPAAPPPGPVLVDPKEPSPWKGPVWTILILIAGVLAYRWVEQRRFLEDKPVRFVRTAKVRTGDIERTIRVSGVTASPRFRYLIAPKIEGSRRDRASSELTLTLEKLLAGGTRVRTGQIVAEFDRQYMLTRIDDLRSSVIQEQATLTRLRANLHLRRTQEQQRLRAAKGQIDKAALDLKTAPVRSAMQIERYKMDLEAAEARYKQLLAAVPFADASELAYIRRYEIEVEQAENEVRKGQRNADQMIYRAPIDGVLVLRRNSRGSDQTEIQQGDIIGPGQTFAEIVDTSVLVLQGGLNQADAELVKIGLKARVHIDAFPRVEMSGTVGSVGAVTKSGQRPFHVREVPLQVRIDEPAANLVPNLTASADVILASEQDVLIVPRECVFRDRDRSYAMVQTEEGWEKRELELGLANHLEVAVQSGLKDGETVAAESVDPAQ